MLAQRQSCACERMPPATASLLSRFVRMNERVGTAVVLGVCAGLLIIGLVFSARLTAGISHAAHMEATQQSPVPTPPALMPAKTTPAKAAPAHA